MSGIYIGGYSEDYEGDTIVAVGLTLAAVKRETLSEVKRMCAPWKPDTWIHCYTLEGVASFEGRIDYDRKARAWREAE